MGFQTGTQVDPRLLDYSGYAQGITNAATIQATALADLGAKVGTAVEEYKEKKKEKELKASTISSLTTMILNNKEIAKTLGLEKGAIDTGEVDEAGEPIYKIDYDRDAAKAAASSMFDVLKQEGSTALVGANYLQALEAGQEEAETGGLSQMEDFRLEVGQNKDYKFQKKGGNTILTKRGPDGKFSEVGPNDPIFQMTDNPKAYYLFFTSDRAGLFSD